MEEDANESLFPLSPHGFAEIFTNPLLLVTYSNDFTQYSVSYINSQFKIDFINYEEVATTFVTNLNFKRIAEKSALSKRKASFEINLSNHTYSICVHPFKDALVCTFDQADSTSKNNTTLKDDKSSVSESFLSSEPQAKRLKRNSPESTRNFSFALIAENIPQVVFSANPDGHVDFFSNKMKVVTGREPSDFLGWNWYNHIHTDDQERIMQAWKHSLSTGTFYQAEFRFMISDNQYIWLDTKASPVRDGKGTIIKWYGICIEINERKAIEEDRKKTMDALIISEQRYSTLFNSDVIGIISVTDWQIVDANPMFLKMIGYTKEDLPIHWKTIANHDPEGESRLKLLSEKRNFPPAETELRKKDGRTIPVLVGGAPVNSISDNVIAFVLDIASRKQAERAALEAVNSKSYFIANISHELRTPLNGVCGMTELLFDTPLNKQQREYVQIVRKSSELLLMLINNILDFSKMEVGKMILEQDEFEVQAAVEDIVDLLGEASNAKGIELLYLVHEPHLFSKVMGDYGRLRQILINLVNNAIKFTEVGQVLIQVFLQHKGADGSVILRFQIEDSGVGITQEQISKLFQPFTQLDNSSTRVHTGTGLGLTICRQLVELFGGQIGVDSTLGKGSVFWFTVKLKISPSYISAGRRPSLPAILPSLRVLIAYPNRVVHNVLQSYFKDWGITSQAAVNETGLRELIATAVQNNHRFDVVFSASELLPVVLETIQKVHIFSSVKIVTLGSNYVNIPSPLVSFNIYTPIRHSKVLEALLRTMSILPDLGEHTVEDVRKPPQKYNSTVLLVEDNAVNQKVAEKQLERLGVTRIVVAGNGAEALKLLEQSTKFSLILMDCQMPVMDGLTATREIRNREKYLHWPRIPIIALTANVMNEAAAQCFAAGMDDYISKPVKSESLKNVLNKWLAKETT